MKNFNYFYNTLGLSAANFAVYYDFNEGTNPIPSISGANSKFSGVLSSVGSFYSISGSGQFSGQNVQISNATGLNKTNFSMLFVYHKTNQPNGVLFSSLTSGGANPSGFIVGINDANRLYFETYDNNGPQIYTSSNIYGSKNAISIVKSNNILNFYYYNFNSLLIEPEEFNISTTANYQSNIAYLGAPINAPSYITQNSFTGYMDQFIYLNNAINPNVIQNLFSGFYSSKNPSTVGSVVQCNSQISGAGVTYTGVGTGITGYHVFQAGIAVDNCGNQTPIFSYNNLTGTISGDVFLPLTNVVCVYTTGLIDNGYYIDTGYCSTFGMNGISFLKNVTGLQELYVANSIHSTGVNLKANFNLNGNFILDTSYQNGQINLYDNGLLKLNSGYYISGNNFNNYLYLLGDYYISGRSVLSTGFGISDEVYYDNIGNSGELFYFTNSGGQSFSTNNINNRIVFLNGAKLVSGANYNYTSNTLNILANKTGIILTAAGLSGDIYYTGNFSDLQISKFSRNTSEIWNLGVKQIMGIDYIEDSNIDLLNASGVFNTGQNILFSGNFQFAQSL